MYNLQNACVSDINPEQLGILPLPVGYADIQAGDSSSCSTKQGGGAINVSSSTSAIPPSSSTSTSYPSPIVSDSMQTVGSNDHRVSAINNADANLGNEVIELCICRIFKTEFSLL